MNNNQNKINILNKYFNNIYVLYITEIELNRIKPKLVKKNIQVEYFLGVNGKKTLSNKFNLYYENHRANKSKVFLKTVGAYGHIYSFIKILENAIKKKYNKILILEPDIHFSLLFDTQVEKYLKMDYKLLYLGASQHNWTNIDNLNKSFMKAGGYYFAQSTCGTFAIGIDKSIFLEYISILRKMLTPSDICLYEIHNKYQQQCIVCYPNLIICDVTKSSTVDRWKSQLEIANKFRWECDNYDISDRFLYHVNIDTVYKVIIEINHYIKNKKCNIQIIDEFDPITPIITIPTNIMIEKKIKKINGNNVICVNYILYLHSKLDTIYILTNNIYLDKVYFVEFFKLTSIDIKQNLLTFKNRFTSCLLSHDVDMKNYYYNLIEFMKEQLIECNKFNKIKALTYNIRKT